MAGSRLQQYLGRDALDDGTRAELGRILKAGPWCWPRDSDAERVANARRLTDLPGPPSTPGEALLVTVNRQTATLWSLGDDPGGAPFGEEAAAAWQAASAALEPLLAISREARTLWPLSASTHELRAVRLESQHVGAGIAAPERILDGRSFGLSFFLAQASAVLGMPIPERFAASAEIDRDGRLRPVGGLDEKIAVAVAAAPRVRCLLVAQEDEAAARHARDAAGADLEISAQPDAAAALAKVFGDFTVRSPFIERDVELRHALTWLDAHPGGAGVVLAAPGRGKTTFAACLFREVRARWPGWLCVRHFIKGPDTFHHVITALFGELDRATGQPAGRAAGGVAELRQRLTSSAAARRVVVIVDGLDELGEGTERKQLLGLLAGRIPNVTWLCLGQPAPELKPMPAGLEPLALGEPAHLEEGLGLLDAVALRRYLLADPKYASLHPWLNSDASLATFDVHRRFPVLLRILLDDVLNERIRVEDGRLVLGAAELPSEPVAYYDELLTRIEDSDRFTRDWEVLALLAEAAAPLSGSLLAELLGEREPLRKLPDAISGWAEEQPVPYVADALRGWTLFHQSFAAHVRSFDDDVGQAPNLRLTSGQRARLLAARKNAVARLRALALRWKAPSTAAGDYALRYGDRHLIAANDLGNIRRVLADGLLEGIASSTTLVDALETGRRLLAYALERAAEAPSDGAMSGARDRALNVALDCWKQWTELSGGPQRAAEVPEDWLRSRACVERLRVLVETQPTFEQAALKLAWAVRLAALSRPGDSWQTLTAAQWWSDGERLVSEAHQDDAQLVDEYPRHLRALVAALLSAGLVTAEAEVAPERRRPLPRSTGKPEDPVETAPEDAIYGIRWWDVALAKIFSVKLSGFLLNAFYGGTFTLGAVVALVIYREPELADVIRDQIRNAPAPMAAVLGGGGLVAYLYLRDRVVTHYRRCFLRQRPPRRPGAVDPDAERRHLWHAVRLGSYLQRNRGPLPKGFDVRWPARLCEMLESPHDIAEVLRLSSWMGPDVTRPLVEVLVRLRHRAPQRLEQIYESLYSAGMQRVDPRELLRIVAATAAGIDPRFLIVATRACGGTVHAPLSGAPQGTLSRAILRVLRDTPVLRAPRGLVSQALDSIVAAPYDDPAGTPPRGGRPGRHGAWHYLKLASSLWVIAVGIVALPITIVAFVAGRLHDPYGLGEADPVMRDGVRRAAREKCAFEAFRDHPEGAFFGLTRSERRRLLRALLVWRVVAAEETAPTPALTDVITRLNRDARYRAAIAVFLQRMLRPGSVGPREEPRTAPSADLIPRSILPLYPARRSLLLVAFLSIGLAVAATALAWWARIVVADEVGPPLVRLAALCVFFAVMQHIRSLWSPPWDDIWHRGRFGWSVLVVLAIASGVHASWILGERDWLFYGLAVVGQVGVPLVLTNLVAPGAIARWRARHHLAISRGDVAREVVLTLATLALGLAVVCAWWTVWAGLWGSDLLRFLLVPGALMPGAR